MLTAKTLKIASAGAMLIFVILAPFTLQPFYIEVCIAVGIYVLLAIGMHIMWGLGGVVFVGYAAFFLTGAYVTAYANTVLKVPIWWCFPLAVLGAALLGLLSGLATLRLRREYFMVASLAIGALAQLVVGILNVTGGPNGLYGVAPPSFFGHLVETPNDFYVFVVVLVIGSFAIVSRWQRSAMGRSWVAIGRDDIAAEAAGVPTFRIKLILLCLGAAWGGLAGAFFATQITAVSPSSFGIDASVSVLSIVLVGGLGSLPGVVLGTLVMIGLPGIFPNIAEWGLVVSGAAIMLVLRFRRSGAWPASPWRPLVTRPQVEVMSPDAQGKPTT